MFILNEELYQFIMAERNTPYLLDLYGVDYIQNDRKV